MCSRVLTSLSQNISLFGLAASNARKVRATGRGLQPVGVRVGDEADFKVISKGAGEGDVMVKVIGPGKCKIQGAMSDVLETNFEKENL